jgi:di/tricarboxylate transporter
LLYIIVAFLLEAMRPGLILFSAAVIFMATGIITDEELITGFSNNGVVTIVVLFLVNEGIRQSGLITRLAQAYLPRKKNPMPFLIPRIMIPVAVLSAFLNNLPMVVNITPLLNKWVDIMRLSYKKFLIPLSYAAILGGMCTLIGTSSNLVVHGLMIDSGLKGLHLFELAKVGGVISIIGFIYMALLGNLLLPGKRIYPSQQDYESKDYYYNLLLTENSKFIGQSVLNERIPGLNGLNVRSVERNNKILTPKKSQEIKLHSTDHILVSGSSDRLNYILAHKEVILSGMNLLGNVQPEELKQYEVVLSPRFAGLGQTLKEFNFFEHFNAVVLAVHRNGERITANLNNLKLRVGDNVVLLSTSQFAETWETSSMFYLVNYVRDYRPEKTSRKKWLAFSILGGMVLAIVINELVSWGYGMRLNIFFFVAVAALLLVWFKIMPQQNYTRSVSWDLVVTIAAALAVSKGIQNAGVAEIFAKDAIGVVKSMGPVAVMAVIFIFTSFLTEIITNNAAVALVYPVALVAAQMLEVDPKPFIIAIAIAGASSFMTARGYRANLIIKAIGKYSRKDFLLVGTPMQIMAFIISIWLIPYFWPF